MKLLFFLFTIFISSSIFANDFVTNAPKTVICRGYAGFFEIDWNSEITIVGENYTIKYTKIISRNDKPEIFFLKGRVVNGKIRLPVPDDDGMVFLNVNTSSVEIYDFNNQPSYLEFDDISCK